MQLKAARSAGALYLLSPVAVPGLALKTRGDAHYTMIFRRVLPKGERENPRGQVVLRVRGSTGALGKLTCKEIVASVGVIRRGCWKTRSPENARKTFAI